MINWYCVPGIFFYANQNPINAIDPWGLMGYSDTINDVMSPAELHYIRNEWNKTDKSIDYRIANWKLLSSDESIYHRMGKGNENNLKFVSSDGHKEMVLDENNCPVKDDKNMATYNFFGPRTLLGVPHFVADVIPYYVLGNTPSDMFTSDRFTTTGVHLWNKALKTMAYYYIEPIYGM